VLQDYKSDVLDLKDPNVYRDLSKPIGALNEKRLKDFITRYNDTPEGEKYLYGTHYSCPGYVIGFLVR
jgi:factor associated with neutral sphingomyelinase activation